MKTDYAVVHRENNDGAFAERVRATVELLELIAADRSLLHGLPANERERLHQAVAEVYHPDPVARRRRLKAAERARSAEQIRRVESVLDDTGIRTLRRKPVFTTPNVFPPERFESHDVHTDERERRESVELQHCYVCKQ